AEILGDPDRFVILDEEMPLALLDQKHAGKKLLLITNSEWGYAAPIMRYAVDRYLPKGMTWRDLFDVIIVGARKPEFFTTRSPLFEVATEEGLLRPSISGLREHTPYFGGSASQVEKHLGLSGDEILYVGDHMYGDVLVSKDVLRWRTALILRELEDEIVAVQRFRGNEARLAALMEDKERLEGEYCATRLLMQRRQAKYGPAVAESEDALHERLNGIRARLDELDAQIAPLARTATEQSNPTWGLLMRAGNDKSHLARQVERYADIYTSRVSNLLYGTPFMYLRSPRGSLPHDPSLPGAHPSAADGAS
ncbi:MAG: 5'-nucleotidase domain-containing protein, partial [Myxococcales bacterium]